KDVLELAARLLHEVAEFVAHVFGRIRSLLAQFFTLGFDVVEDGFDLGLLLVTLVAGFARAADTAPTTQPSRRGLARPGDGPPPVIDRVREMLSDLKLSDDQNADVEKVLTKAREQFGEMRKDLDGMEPRERMEHLRDFVGDVKDQLGGVLTAEQKKQF